MQPTMYGLERKAALSINVPEIKDHCNREWRYKFAKKSAKNIFMLYTNFKFVVIFFESLKNAHNFQNIK